MTSISLDALKLLGYTYLSNNKLEEAIIVFEVLLELEKEDFYAFKCLAWLYVQQGRGDDALQAVNYCLQFIRDKNQKKAAYLIKAQALRMLNRNQEADLIVQEMLQIG